MDTLAAARYGGGGEDRDPDDVWLFRLEARLRAHALSRANGFDEHVQRRFVIAGEMVGCGA